MQLTLSEIAAMIQAPPLDAASVTVSGYSIDSRTVRRGDMFFAVRGQRLDGHDYVQAALDAGAAAAVVAAGRLSEFPAVTHARLLPVPDSLRALQALAAAVRKRWGGPVIAITGSAGKTTTKQMIAALLRPRYQVLENQGNLNNHFGLPLSLLRLEPSHQVGVFELGMSAAGEIRVLAGLAQPSVGVVTNVSEAHLEFFPDVEAIARAKFELVEALGKDDWAVLNADDARVAAFGPRCKSSVFYYGLSDAAQFRAEDLQANGSGGWTFSVRPSGYVSIPAGAAWKKAPAGEPQSAQSEATRFSLPLLGRHNVLNALAALSVAHLFGLAPSLLAEAVARLRPAAQRGEIVRLASGALVVNDCYNSNPEALGAMLEAVAAMPAKRRVAVLGGMMELGPESDALHRRCGRRVAELHYDALLTVGELVRPLAEGALEAGLAEGALRQYAAPEDAGERLRGWLRAGDVVLLKASRAVHLERVFDTIGDLPESPAAAHTAADAGKGA